MNLAETLQLLDKLNSIGAKHFKSAEIEVSMLPDTTLVVRDKPQTTNVVQPPAEAETPINAANTEKVQRMIDLLKMKDDMLANEIFPDGA